MIGTEDGYIKKSDALNCSKIVYIEYLECIGEPEELDGDCDDIPVVFKKDIEALPFADVVEVVRCKDCFYGRIYGNSNSYYCVLTTACHGDDFFCANGARMDGE